MIRMRADSSIAAILRQRRLDSERSLWQRRLANVTAREVEAALASRAGSYSPTKLLALVSPAAEPYLERMAEQSRDLTVRRFGRAMRLYAPLYLSSYCINKCRYCGFNADHGFERIRLTLEQALEEANVLAAEGFRDVLLVSGEDRTFVTIDYLTELARRLKGGSGGKSEIRNPDFSFVGAEIYQMSADDYGRLFEAGIEGVTLYQETYDREAYARYHGAGPKADYDARLRGPDDMATGGMREIGLGVLLGLADWRVETLALAEHAHYLIKRYWQSRISFSFPRLRPACGVSTGEFAHLLTDKDLVQMMLALRLCFADAGLVLSTRESRRLRDRLVGLGVTRLSAGSRTNPGGYTHTEAASEQFAVDDSRCPAEVAAMLSARGFEPVWKDWDRAFQRQ